MAPSLLTLNTLATTGTLETLVAADVNGNLVPNVTGRSFIVVLNGSGSSITVTVTVVPTIPGITITIPAITVPAGARMMIPFPASYYVNNASNQVRVDYSSVTTVTVGAFTT